jgi:SAM-dependent methyltransferase
MDKEIGIRGNSINELSSDSSKFYENYWKEGEVISQTTQHRNQFICNQFFPKRIEGKRVLEIGVGGEGGNLLNLKNKNEVFGIDISKSAQKNCERLGLNIIIQNIDKEALPFDDDFFDIVFAFEVFEHFAAPQYALEEIRRVLKTGGILLLSTPNPYIHHWPRLFYPELFEEKAFRDFILINRFQLLERKCFGKNRYRHLLSDPSSEAWSWIWFCEKIDMNNPGILFDYGKYFWEQTDEFGIRKKPIEAIDLFEDSFKKDPKFLEARFMLTRALIYRFINGEKEEFIKNINFIIDCAKSDRYPQNMEALYHLAMIYIELKKNDIGLITDEQFHETVYLLAKFTESSERIASIQKEFDSLNTQ